MSDNIEKSFTVSSPVQLNVNNIRGSIIIQPGEDGTIQVTATKQPHTGDANRTEVNLSQGADGAVNASTRFPDISWNWISGWQPCEVDYVVKAPHQSTLVLNGVSSSILAEGFKGDTNVKSVSGEISLKEIKGTLKIHTVSGGVEGERITGSLIVETVSGDLVLKESDLSSIKGNTVSGDLRINTRVAEGPYNFNSVSGDVRLIVPPETRCTCELHSLSGDLGSIFPTDNSFPHHGLQMNNIQGGGVKISLHSVSGDLFLDCSSPLPQPSGLPGSDSQEKRRTVLDRVDRGELTVDEALTQLHE